MPQITGIAELNRKLKELEKQYTGGKKRIIVQVGFTAAYAIYVHEDTQARHSVGQAKYLESPARQYASDLGTIASKITAATRSMEKGLLAAGLRLQREAQQLTPVDTGNLKNSAYTALEENANQAAAEAYAKGQSMMQKTLKSRAKATAKKASRRRKK